MSCNYNTNGNTYNIGMGCCRPSIMPADDFYTKPQIDAMLEEIKESGCCITEEEVDEKIESAKTEIESEIPSLSGYATEQWVEDKHYITGVDLSDYATEQWVEDKGYLTEHQPLKTINNQVISGSGNIVISGDTADLTNYYNKQEVDSLINSISSDVTQYITNIQQQINSLISTVSGCCGSSAETQYRWITMTGENDYWCDDTTKKVLEKQQSSTDGLTWTDTGSIRSGSTVLEYDCVDCGYDINTGYKLTFSDGYVIHFECYLLEEVECSGVTKYKVYHDLIKGLAYPNEVKRIDIGPCVELIGADAFSGLTNLQKVVMPVSFKSKYSEQCDGIDANAFEYTGIRTVGLQGSAADVVWNDNMDDMAEQMFKGCTALTSVELPSTFKAFQPKVFSGCTNLQSITIHATTLPILNAFAGIHIPYDGLDDIGNNTFVIYVPANMVDTYKNAVDNTGYRNWSKYASHIQPIT